MPNSSRNEEAHTIHEVEYRITLIQSGLRDWYGRGYKAGASSYYVEANGYTSDEVRRKLIHMLSVVTPAPITPQPPTPTNAPNAERRAIVVPQPRAPRSRRTGKYSPFKQAVRTDRRQYDRQQTAIEYEFVCGLCGRQCVETHPPGQPPSVCAQCVVKRAGSRGAARTALARKRARMRRNRAHGS